MDIFFFTLFALIAVCSGVCVVTLKHPISCALSLIGVMGSLAILYLLLGAEFIAMAQIIVYAGAIMVLFVFVIMLLNTGGEEHIGHSLLVKVLGVPALLAFVAILSYFFAVNYDNATRVEFGAFTHGTPHDVGNALFKSYLLPFEVTSILILIAILGAVVLARKEID
jgi:NADH-quinone oxidoreductase subunit J